MTTKGPGICGNDAGTGSTSGLLAAYTMTRGTSGDPLERFPAFIEAVRGRLDAGRLAYGERSFSARPEELLKELQQEALDLAGWGYVLFRRLEAMRLAMAEPDPKDNER